MDAPTSTYAGAALRLEKGAVKALSLRRGASARVACEQGCAWVTGPGNPGDHVLREGESARFAGPGRVVAQALEPALLRLRIPAVANTYR